MVRVRACVRACVANREAKSLQDFNRKPLESQGIGGGGCACVVAFARCFERGLRVWGSVAPAPPRIRSCLEAVRSGVLATGHCVDSLL